VEEALDKLTLVMSNLLKTRNEIGSAKNKIGKDSIKKLGNQVDNVNLYITKVEAATEEDELYMERKIQEYDQAIQMLHVQIDELKQKLKHVDSNMRAFQESKNEEMKKLKQSEFCLLSKCNIFKGRFNQLQQEFDAFKLKSADEKEKSKELEVWLFNEVN
jgi:hypothetical protein